MALKELAVLAALAAAALQSGTMPLAVTSAGAAFANAFAPLFFDAFERNQLPDFLTRIGIRQLLQLCVVHLLVHLPQSGLSPQTSPALAGTSRRHSRSARARPRLPLWIRN